MREAGFLIGVWPLAAARAIGCEARGEYSRAAECFVRAITRRWRLGKVVEGFSLLIRKAEGGEKLVAS